MMPALILLACGFTYAVALSSGKLFLALLRLKSPRSEEHFFGFVLGAACLSTLVFCLTAAGLAYPTVFLIFGFAIIAIAFRLGVYRFSKERLPVLSPGWRLLFGAVFAAFAILYLVNALLPETVADAVIYHVPLIARYLREHHFVPAPTLYANFPAGIEMLYLFAFAFGKHSAPAMVHLLFTMVLAFGILSYGRRINAPVAGAVASLLVFLSPIVGRDGTAAYIDVAAGCLVFATYYALEIWRERQDPRWLIPIGVLCGFCCAAKYTLAVIIPFALAFVMFYSWRLGRSVVPPVLKILGCALIIVAPWLLKNAVFTGNPIAPFGNRFFPNPYMYVWVEQAWTKWIGTHSVPEWRFPWMLTVDGRGTVGIVGPVFLLSPLLLLALRRADGRRLALAAVFFSLIHFVTFDARFLIPALLFVALALSLALADYRVAASVVILHALLSWPSTLRLYTSAETWRLNGMEWRAALRLQPESEFLRNRIFDYEIGLSMDRLIPPGEPVFGFLGVQECYQSHVVIGSWQSALGVRLGEAIYAPVKKELQPVWRHRYRFTAVVADKIRLIQQASSSADRWSITELHFRYKGQEVQREPTWIATASHNHWDASLALDGNNVSRWTTGQPYTPGMFFETDFKRSLPIDEIVVECTRDQPAIRMALDLHKPDGWERAPEALSTYDDPPPGLRRAAMEFFKTNRVHWMVVHNLEPLMSDFREHASEWGITLVASARPFTIYRLP